MTLLLAGDFGNAERTAWLDRLRETLPEEHVVDQRGDVPDAQIDAAIVANPPAGALQGLPNLAFIQSLWAGVDRLLRDPTLPPGVPLARMVDPAMNQAMAETALWAVLSLHRGYFAYARRQRERRWQVHAQRRADETGVAVLGLGEMGRTVAERLVHNGYHVSGWSTRAVALAGVDTRVGDAALPEVLGSADIVINLLPLTPRTAGLFDAETFASMCCGAGFVNLARGAHVVDADLLAALASGQVRHAVLDVFHTEPLPADHVFWNHPQVTLLPHAAALTDPRSACAVAASNLRAWRAGRQPRGLVDRSRGY